MTKKTAKAPFDGRRLTNEQKRKAMNLAAEKFQDAELRKKEHKAANKFIGALISDAKHLAASGDLEVLAKYNRVRTINELALSDTRNVKVGMKMFELSDGKKVERPDIQSIFSCDGFDKPFHFSIYENQWGEGLAPVMRSARHLYRPYYGVSSIRLKLPGDFRFPGRPQMTKSGSEMFEEKICWFKDQSAYDAELLTWVSAKTKTALDRFYLANKERYDAEIALLRTLWKVVIGSNYGEIKALWPEIAEIEEDLFGIAKLTSTALTVLNQDDVALLCNAMTARGVHSTTCIVASSPANAEALAHAVA